MDQFETFRVPSEKTSVMDEDTLQLDRKMEMEISGMDREDEDELGKGKRKGKGREFCERDNDECEDSSEVRFWDMDCVVV